MIKEKEPTKLSVDCKVLTADGLKFQPGSLNITADGKTFNLQTADGTSVAVVEAEALLSAFNEIRNVDVSVPPFPAQNGSTDKFPFQTVPGEGLTSGEENIVVPVINVGLRQLIEAEFQKNQSYSGFKDAVIGLIESHGLPVKPQAPVDNAASATVEPISWQAFRETGLTLAVNQLLHIFGLSLSFDIVDGEVTNCFPARVNFRGFDDAATGEHYGKIAAYMKDNAAKLWEDIQ